MMVMVCVGLAGCITADPPQTPEIAPPSFPIAFHGEDLNRSARKNGQIYGGKLIDTHAHLYPPPVNQRSINQIDRRALEKIIKIIQDAGVETIIVMPTPNDGIRPNQEMGVVRRQVARELNSRTITLFFGSNYITNWLDQAFRSGYEQSELNTILERIDQESQDFIGLGELSFYHFDKGYGKKQHVIKFPPNFEPFMKILDLAAKKGLWVDLHAEPVTKQGRSFENETFGGIELILKRNPDLKLIYSHTAMTNVSNARQILKIFPQVMMNIKLEPKHDRWGHLGPVVNTDGEIYKDWAILFEEMPERFMVGTDFHFDRKGVNNKKYRKKIKQFRYMLGTLNGRAAWLIAYENARQLIDSAHP